jgi:hypothetical protein
VASGWATKSAAETEGEHDEGPDQNGVPEVDGEVREVPAEWVVTARQVAEREGEVGHDPVGQVAGRPPERAQVPDGGVVDDLGRVVEEELAVKGAGVGERAEEQDGHDRERILRSQRRGRGVGWNAGAGHRAAKIPVR